MNDHPAWTAFQGTLVMLLGVVVSEMLQFGNLTTYICFGGALLLFGCGIWSMMFD